MELRVVEGKVSNDTVPHHSGTWVVVKKEGGNGEEDVLGDQWLMITRMEGL